MWMRSQVEQIIFNLVDNTCKYAAPASSESTLHVEVKQEGSNVAVRRPQTMVRASAEAPVEAPVIVPFEKSATEDRAQRTGGWIGLRLVFVDWLVNSVASFWS